MQDPADVPEWADVATAEARERAAAMPPMTTKQAVSVVATGSGMVIVPMSVARLHHRKDVVHRPVTGVAPSGVASPGASTTSDPRIEDFIGIVRGRTERSSRGASAQRAGDDATGERDASGRHTPSGGERRQERGRALPQRGAAPRRRGGTTRGQQRRRGRS